MLWQTVGTADAPLSTIYDNPELKVGLRYKTEIGPKATKQFCIPDDGIASGNFQFF